MKSKTIPIYTTCAHCVYCISASDDTKHCYYNPPTVIVINDEPFVLRPEIEDDDHICGYFKGKH